MEIAEPSDFKYRLIQIIDRGSLKWPSSCVIDAIITLWKLYSAIENQPGLIGSFVTGSSRKILIHLTITVLENEQGNKLIYGEICATVVVH